MLFRQTSRSLTVLAPAKLNLFLRIVAKRVDGFHDLESVMATIGVYDTLVLEAASSGEIELSVVDSSPRTMTGSMRLEAPVGPENLVLRAAHLLRERTSCRNGARITLVKRIPSSAGLGGGSSDCAAALAGLNRLWNLKLSRTELLALAGELGSDVAFFLADTPMAVCTGRGEHIEPLRCSTRLHFVVAKPMSGLSTPAVFRRWSSDQAELNANSLREQGRGQRSGPESVPSHSASLLTRRGGVEELEVTRRVPDSPTVASFIDSLVCHDVGSTARRLHNGLQAPAEALNSDVRQMRQLFERLPVIGHQMSGSGSSYFGICASRRQAQGIASRLRAAGVPWVQAVRSCP